MDNRLNQEDQDFAECPLFFAREFLLGIIKFGIGILLGIKLGIGI